MKITNNLNINKRGFEFTDKHGNILEFDMAIKKIKLRFSSYFTDFMLYFLNSMSLHVPFHGFRLYFFRKAGMKIGKGSTIHMGCKLFYPGNITIGNDTVIGDRSFLDGRDKLTIGNHVDIASEVMIYNSQHDINNEYFEAVNEPVTIEDYVFIGPRSIILPGVLIGKGAVVAAGAVVTKNIPNNGIYGGVPAVKIGNRVIKNLNYTLGRAKLFQ